VASLLELGAGFHPDLTGRENVFINAAFLGIHKREIARRFDEIVAFAELDAFIDQQVKYYSSGMFIRLGFAVATNVDPDVLLVDEVLAVGDEAFQQKCMERVEQFQRDGRTILFVTHSADTVRRICNRAVVLHHGEMVANTAPGEAIRVFREHLHGTMHEVESGISVADDSGVTITDVRFAHPGGPARSYLLAGEPLRIVVAYDAREPQTDIVLAFEIRNNKGETVFAATSDDLGGPLPTLVGPGELEIDLASIPLLDGRYPVSLQLRRHLDGKVVALRENTDAFEVMNPGRQSGMVLLPATVRAIGAPVPSRE
jgi:ABC-2 type transport system ATP-binding protein